MPGKFVFIVMRVLEIALYYRQTALPCGNLSLGFPWFVPLLFQWKVIYKENKEIFLESAKQTWWYLEMIDKCSHSVCWIYK